MNQLLSEMKTQDYDNKLNKIIDRYIKLYKPKGVSDIKIDISSSGMKSEKLRY